MTPAAHPPRPRRRQPAAPGHVAVEAAVAASASVARRVRAGVPDPQHRRAGRLQPRVEPALHPRPRGELVPARLHEDRLRVGALGLRRPRPSPPPVSSPPATCSGHASRSTSDPETQARHPAATRHALSDPLGRVFLGADSLGIRSCVLGSRPRSRADRRYEPVSPFDHDGGTFGRGRPAGPGEGARVDVHNQSKPWDSG